MSSRCRPGPAAAATAAHAASRARLIRPATTTAVGAERAGRASASATSRPRSACPTAAASSSSATPRTTTCTQRRPARPARRLRQQLGVGAVGKLLHAARPGRARVTAAGSTRRETDGTGVLARRRSGRRQPVVRLPLAPVREHRVRQSGRRRGRNVRTAVVDSSRGSRRFRSRRSASTARAWSTTAATSTRTRRSRADCTFCFANDMYTVARPGVEAARPRRVGVPHRRRAGRSDAAAANPVLPAAVSNLNVQRYGNGFLLVTKTYGFVDARSARPGSRRARRARGRTSARSSRCRRRRRRTSRATRTKKRSRTARWCCRRRRCATAACSASTTSARSTPPTASATAAYGIPRFVSITLPDPPATAARAAGTPMSHAVGHRRSASTAAGASSASTAAPS